MENNVIITGLQESQNRKEPENLAEIIRKILITEMGMAQEAADNLQISKIFCMGEFDRNKKYPRPVCIQFSNKIHKDMVMSRVSFLKKKQPPLRFPQQQPEEIREKKKQLYEIQKKYSEKNIDTKVKGDKLIFTQSNFVYRSKVGSRPTAEEIINTDEVKTAVHSGTMETGLSVIRYQRIPSSRSGDQWSTSCVQTPLPVPVTTYTPTVLPAKMDLSTRVLMTMANMEQDGPF